MSLLAFRRRPAAHVAPSLLVPLPVPPPERVAALAAWLTTADADAVDKEIADCLTRLDLYRRTQPALVPVVAGEYAALTVALAATTEGAAA